MHSRHAVWSSLVLDWLASGMTVQDILKEYPQPEEPDVLACIAYAAEIARERYVEVPPPAAPVRLKLDENLGKRAQDVLPAAGHDPSTVLEQGLSGSPDQRLIDTRGAEGPR